ncbi:hypothetical protein L9F63_010116, partial [Diploptera punctata]
CRLYPIVCLACLLVFRISIVCVCSSSRSPEWKKLQNVGLYTPIERAGSSGSVFE